MVRWSPDSRSVNAMRWYKKVSALVSTGASGLHSTHFFPFNTLYASFILSVLGVCRRFSVVSLFRNTFTLGFVGPR